MKNHLEVAALALTEAKKKAGGGKPLAEKIAKRYPETPCTPQAVSQWDRVPVERVLQVEKITGVARHLLRPDIYPAPERKRA